LLEDCFWVYEAAKEGAAVDEVEFSALDPFVFGIVDLEVAIWRDAVVLAFAQDSIL
jgi:hypothetical protein